MAEITYHQAYNEQGNAAFHPRGYSQHNQHHAIGPGKGGKGGHEGAQYGHAQGQGCEHYQ